LVKVYKSDGSVDEWGDGYTARFYGSSLVISKTTTFVSERVIGTFRKRTVEHFEQSSSAVAHYAGGFWTHYVTEDPTLSLRGKG
jgi:hypothetical protein